MSLKSPIRRVVRILVVEDEPAIAESVAYALGKAGHETELATCLKEARTALEQEMDLIVLDLMLPDGSGFDFILELKARRESGLALIVLSSRDSESDRVRALEMGADDYVTKPFSPREVVARVIAVTRRMSPSPERLAEQPHIASSRLSLRAETRRVLVDGTVIDLTRVEFDLLSLLLSKPGHVFSRSTIINDVWGAGFALSDRTIDSHVKALRRKIMEAGGESDWIETVRGIGYRAREGNLH